MNDKQKEVVIYDNKFIIEVDVERPKFRHSITQWLKLVGQMEVGDSVAMTKQQANSCQIAVGKYGYKMSFRTSEHGKARIWLMKKPE